jgi:hypothetical protein
MRDRTFISYCYRDAAHLNDFKPLLAPLMRKGRGSLEPLNPTDPKSDEIIE